MVGRARKIGAGACIGALLMLGLAGCGGSGGGTSSATPGANSPASSGSGGIVIPIEVRLATSSSQSGHGASLSVGDTLELRLETEPGSGWAWVVTKMPDKSILKGSGNSELVPPSPVPGTMTTQVFSFAAVGKGRTEVQISYSNQSGRSKRVSTFNVQVS